MEHTINVLKLNKGLINSLFKFFAMFELRLIDDRDKFEAISIRCISCEIETGLYLRTSTLEEMITKLVLNAILHYMVMLWIICSNGKIFMK